jgi:hypothetical protein
MWIPSETIANAQNQGTGIAASPEYINRKCWKAKPSLFKRRYLCRLLLIELGQQAMLHSGLM